MIAIERGLEIVGVLDIECLHREILRAMRAACGAEGASLWVAGDHHALRLRAWMGHIDVLGLPPEIDAHWVHRDIWFADTSLWVPILSGSQLLAVAQLWGVAPSQDSSQTRAELSLVSQFSARALVNAIVHAHVDRKGLRDVSTGAYTLAYFADYTTKEIQKSRRYSRTFSLLIVAAANVDELTNRLGNEALRALERGIHSVISETVRDSDVVARVSELEFQILLPETDFFGGLMFLRRILNALISSDLLRHAKMESFVDVTGGVAVFPRDGQDFYEILAKCRRRLIEHHGSLQHLLQLDQLSFWEEIELLLGHQASPALPAAPGEPSRRLRLAEPYFDEIQTEVAREMLRRPQARGLVYLGIRSLTSDLPLLRSLEHAPQNFAPRIYVLGARGDLSDRSIVTPVAVDGDARFAQIQFLLWLGDGSAYAVVQRREGPTNWAFHTSDPTLVEALVSKLQEAYDLNPY